MTKIKRFDFPNNIFYRWEIGENFITIYDNTVRYPKNILRFLAETKKLLIIQHGKQLVFEGQDHHRELSPLPKLDTLPDIWVVNSHDDGDETYHPGNTCCIGLFYPRPTHPLHCHLRFREPINHEKILLVINWLAEYANQPTETLKTEFSSVLAAFPEKSDTPLLKACH